MAVKILTYSVNSGALIVLLHCRKNGRLRFSVKGKKSICSVTDELVLWERKYVYANKKRNRVKLHMIFLPIEASVLICNFKI